MIERSFKTAALMLGAIAVLLIACERYVESKDPVRSLPGRPATPINLVAQVNDRSIRLSWELADSAGVTAFRVYRAVDEDEDFTRHDSTAEYTMEVTGLPFNRGVRLRVTAVNSAGIEGLPSEEVSTVVGLLSITIEDDEQYTRRRDVNIQLNAPSPATYVTLSEDSLFQDGASVRPFEPEHSFTLSPGDGEKTVYACFQFEDGSGSGDPISDDIILDTYAQIDSVFYSPSGQTFTSGDTVAFFVAAAGETGGEASVLFPGAEAIRLHDDGAAGDLTADDGIYSHEYLVPVGLTVNNGQLVGGFTDAAGNEAVQTAAAVPLDIKTAPLPVRLTSADAVSSFEISLSWSESPSSDFSLYRIYRDLDNTVSDNSELVVSVDQQSNTEYTDTTLDESTTYYYRVYVVDNSGLRVGSNVDSAMTPVNTLPTAVTVAVALLDSTTARLTWTRNHDHDFESYRIYRDTSTGVSISDDLRIIITDQNTVSYDDYTPFISGGTTIDAYYYRVFVFDRQGLSSSSNEVIVTR